MAHFGVYIRRERRSGSVDDRPGIGFEMKNFVVALVFAAVNYVHAAHTVASSQIVGIVAQQNVNRDSCGSTRLRSDAVLWVCRDSQPVQNGTPTLPIIVNTAAWSTIDSNGNPSLVQTGNANTPYYPLQGDECNDNTAGSCGDGTRWVGWPDTPPLITIAFPNGDVGAYTWVSRQHLQGLGLTPDSINFATSLYYSEYQPDRDGTNLPQVHLINEQFWGANDAPYGTYGSVTDPTVTTAYLYGQRADGSIALAKAPCASVTDKSQYQYYVNGGWTTTKPGRNDTSASILNAGAGGQGTFYYSPLWKEYVWIGGNKFPGATFYMTTAPAPEGPWAAPYQIYQARGGTASLPAYSLQAHPGLTTGTGKDMYLTFTNVTNIYTTPLIHITWGS